MKLRHRTKRVALVMCLGALLLRFTATSAGSQSSGAATSQSKTTTAKARGELAHGDFAHAEATLWTALSDNPNDPEALTLLATIRGRPQRFPEAEAIFKRFLQINANAREAHRG